MRRYGVWLRMTTALLAACAADGHVATSNPSASPVAGASSGTAGASTGAADMLASPAGMSAAPPPDEAGAGAGGRAAAGGGSAGRAAVGGMGAPAGSAGEARSSGGAGQAGRAGSAAAAGSGASAMPVFRVPLRVHVADSKLTDAELGVIFGELNQIWLGQAGVCFEIEVTASETNRSDGFDFRYTAGQIPGASSANGLTQNAHAIWSIDHPRLADVMTPVMNPTARTTAHELGHALGLAHENPPPSNDCASPCYCAQLGEDCDEYLMRSGTKGFHLSKPEIEIARGRATRVALADQSATQCGAPMFMR
jgi:hypothetical protein